MHSIGEMCCSLIIYQETTLFKVTTQFLLQPFMSSLPFPCPLRCEPSSGEEGVEVVGACAVNREKFWQEGTVKDEYIRNLKNVTESP